MQSVGSVAFAHCVRAASTAGPESATSAAARTRRRRAHGLNIEGARIPPPHSPSEQAGAYSQQEKSDGLPSETPETGEANLPEASLVSLPFVLW